MNTTVTSLRLGAYAIDFLDKSSKKYGLTKSDMIRICIFFAIGHSRIFDTYVARVQKIGAIYTDTDDGELFNFDAVQEDEQ